MDTKDMLLLADMIEKTAVIDAISRGFRTLGRTGRSMRRAAQRAGEQGGTLTGQVGAAGGALGRKLDNASARDALNVAAALGLAGLAGYGGKKILTDSSTEASPGVGVLRRY